MEAGYTYKLEYMKVDMNNMEVGVRNKKRKKKIIWFNTPFITNINSTKTLPP